MTDEQERQNTADIAQNTEDIAQNTEDIQANLAELNAGGEERWEHIHANEDNIAANTRSIEVLDDVKIRGVQFKINVVAIFVLVGLMVIAALLQIQATSFRATYDRACHESQVQAHVINDNLDRLARPPVTVTHVDIPVCT